MVKRSLDWDDNPKWWVGHATSENAASRRRALEILLRHRAELKRLEAARPGGEANLGTPTRWCEPQRDDSRCRPASAVGSYPMLKKT